MSKDKKTINITEEELARDIANLNLPEANLLEDIDKPFEDDPMYPDEFNEWLRNGRKEKEKEEDE